MRAGVAVRRICHDASAALRHRAAGQEIDTRRAEPARGDIGRDHRVAAPAEYRWTWRRRRSTAPISGRESGCAGAAPRSPTPASHKNPRPRARRRTHELAGLALRARGRAGVAGRRVHQVRRAADRIATRSPARLRIAAGHGDAGGQGATPAAWARRRPYSASRQPRRVPPSREITSLPMNSRLRTDLRRTPSSSL